MHVGDVACFVLLLLGGGGASLVGSSMWEVYRVNCTCMPIHCAQLVTIEWEFLSRLISLFESMHPTNEPLYVVSIS